MVLRYFMQTPQAHGNSWLPFPEALSAYCVFL